MARDLALVVGGLVLGRGLDRGLDLEPGRGLDLLRALRVLRELRGLRGLRVPLADLLDLAGLVALLVEALLGRGLRGWGHCRRCLLGRSEGRGRWGDCRSCPPDCPPAKDLRSRRNKAAPQSR